MYFLEIDQYSKVKKSTFLWVAIFVITSIIGIGSAVQQFLIKYYSIKPILNLEGFSLNKIVLQLSFLLIPSIFGILSILFATKWKLLRKPITLMGNVNSLRKRIIYTSLLFVGIFLLISFLPEYLKGNLSMHIPKIDLLNYLLVIMIFVFIQVLLEELIFRALLPQMLVGNGMTKWSAIIISSVLFGFLHANNPEVGYYGFWLIGIYILQGIFLGVLSFFDNGILLAIIYHFFNNLFIILFLSTQQQVIKIPNFVKLSNVDHAIGMEILQIILTMLLFFGGCYWLFKWKLDYLKRK